jgi:hypothetical protein
MIDQISDTDVWPKIDAVDLWIYDRLILAKRLGYDCGPAGVAPTERKDYIVRPCSNYRGMGRGASIMTLSPTEHDCVPDGYFWCEQFTGRHLSFDYHYGQQCLAVEGIRQDELRLDRFLMWRKIDDQFKLPKILAPIAKKYEWLNVEVIGDKVIEVHLRYNDDFRNHDGNIIIPVWQDEFYASEAGDRLGFIVKKG